MSSSRSDVPDFVRTQSGVPLLCNSVSYTTTATVFGFYFWTQDIGPLGTSTAVEPTQLLMLQPSTDCFIRFIQAGTVAASGTVTYTAPSGAQTVTIGGVQIAFTAGADAPTTASILAALINTHPSLSAGVVASVATNVTTITARNAGTGGNGITLAATGTGAAASGANLTGGTNPAAGTTATNAVLITANSQFWVYKQANQVQLDLKASSASGTLQIFAVV